MIKNGFNPSFNINYAIGVASELNNLKTVIFLLKDKRVNPADDYNYAILYTTDNDIISLLWNDERVKKSLKNDGRDLYDELVMEDIKNKVENF